MDRAELNDGVALMSAAHPRPALWRTVITWFKPVPRFNPASLETVEIEMKPGRGGLRPGPRK